MKRKLLNSALLVFLSVIWLNKCHPLQDHYFYFGACLAAYLCLSLIPLRAAAAAAAAVITLGTAAFFHDYFVSYAPVIFACTALFTAASGKATRPFIKDYLLFSALSASVACTCVSLYITLVSQKTLAFMHPPLERYHIYSILCAVLLAALTVCSVCMHIKRRTPRAGTGKDVYGKLTAAFVLMLAAFTATGLCYMKETSRGQISLLPDFVGTFAAVTEGMYILLPD